MTSEVDPRAERLATEVLEHGLDDWVALYSIEGPARLAGVEPDAERMTLVLAVLEDLVEDGFIELGEVSSTGYTSWSGSLASMLSRIEVAWSTSDREQYGFICWTRNTEAGDARAELQARAGE